MEAARITTEGRIGLGGVAQRYNASVEMYGNSFFRPGSTVYINTTSLSARFGNTENDQSLSHKLGIGGYYNIDLIKSRLTPTGYMTSLECTHIGTGLPSPIRKKAVTTAQANRHQQEQLNRFLNSIKRGELHEARTKAGKALPPSKTQEAEVEVKKYEFAGPNADRHVDASEESGGNVNMKWAAEMSHRYMNEEWFKFLGLPSPYDPDGGLYDIDFDQNPGSNLGMSPYQSLDEQLDSDEKFNKWLIERNKEEKSRTNVGDFWIRNDDDDEEVA